MHDQRAMLEHRLERFVRDHLKPAVYRGAAPVTVTGWDAPGEPVPFSEAIEQAYGPVEIGSNWGRPWGTTWLHVTGQVPPAWLSAGRPPDGTSVELVVDLGFTGGPGFNAEGLAWRPDGTIIKAISPDNHWLPVDPRPDRLLPGGRRQPRRGAIPTSTRPRSATRRPPATPALRAAALDVGLLDDGLGAAPRHLDAARPDAGAAGDDAAPVRDPARPHADGRRRRSRRRRRHRRRGARRAGRRAGARPASPRPQDRGRRPRAHRLRLAVAAARDGPQVRPDVEQRGRRWPTPIPTSSSPAPRPSSTPG